MNKKTCLKYKFVWYEYGHRLNNVLEGTLYAEYNALDLPYDWEFEGRALEWDEESRDFVEVDIDSIPYINEILEDAVDEEYGKSIMLESYNRNSTIGET